MRRKGSVKINFFPRVLVVALFLSTLPASVYGEEIELAVPASPLWTRTGIEISAGEQLTVYANPDDRWSWPGTEDASGSQPWFSSWDRFLYVASHGELIGYVGDDPYQGNWGNLYYYYDWSNSDNPLNGSAQLPGYLHIGETAVTSAGFQWTADRSGKLWLGFNDDAVSCGVGDNSGQVNVKVVTASLKVSAKIDILPATLNVDSKGQWMSLFIQLPLSNAGAIDLATVRVTTASGASIPVDLNAPSALGDHDGDGVADLMAKVDRNALLGGLCGLEACTAGADFASNLVVSGFLTDGKTFTGSTTLRVINKP